MNWKQIKSNWTGYVPRLHARWPSLDYDILIQTKGERRAVVKHMVATLHYETITAEIALEDWMHCADMELDASPRHNAA